MKQKKVLLYGVHIRISKHKRQLRKRNMGEKSKGVFKYGTFERLNKKQKYVILKQILHYKKSVLFPLSVWHFDLLHFYFSQLVFVSQNLPLKSFAFTVLEPTMESAIPVTFKFSRGLHDTIAQGAPLLRSFSWL